MARFGMRTRRFLAVLWLGTAALEVAVLWMADRTNNSWFLLLALGVLVIPIVAAERTQVWLSRPRRKRWKRHDVEEGLAVAPDAPPSPAPPPSHPTP